MTAGRSRISIMHRIGHLRERTLARSSSATVSAPIQPWSSRGSPQRPRDAPEGMSRSNYADCSAVDTGEPIQPADDANSVPAIRPKRRVRRLLRQKISREVFNEPT
jgi:hypothetical protein